MHENCRKRKGIAGKPGLMGRNRAKSTRAFKRGAFSRCTTYFKYTHLLKKAARFRPVALSIAC